MGAEVPKDSPKPICVVVDTSVWRAELLLKTPLGVTLVYTMHRQGGVIGLPEVVERELKAQIIEAGFEAADKAGGPVHMLRTITDDPFLRIPIPTRKQLSEKVDERLAQLAPVLTREPFTLEHAKAALEMVSAKMPPNGEKNQQFKDSAIWQAVLALSLRHSTVLLTNDKSFFRDKDPVKGLASNLIGDCTKASTSVQGYLGIGSYLKAIESAVPEFDRERAKELILPAATPLLGVEAKRYKLAPAELLECSISAFPTESPDRLAIDYTLAFKLDPVSLDYRVMGLDDPRGIIHGSGYLLPKKMVLTDHYVQRVAIKSQHSLYARSFEDSDGTYAFPRPLPWD